MNSNWIKKVQQEISRISQENWIPSILSSTEEKLKDAEIHSDNKFYREVYPNFFKISLKEFEENNIISLFELLNISIIGGECFNEDFNNNIVKSISLCNRFQFVDLDEIIEEEELRRALEDIISKFEPLSILKNCLIEYKSTAQFLVRQVENPSLNTLFDLSDQTQDMLDDLKIKNQHSNVQSNLLLLIQNNLFLLRKDFTLRYESNNLQQLLISQNKLKICQKFFSSTPNSSISELIFLLIEKSSFLIRKFIIRKYKDKDIHNENYVFLGKETNFDLESHQLKLEVFKEWDTYSRNHFLSEENYEKEVLLKRNAQKTLRIGKNSTHDYHSLIKYYKDLENNLPKLEQLEEDSKNIYYRNTVFDEYAENINRNYLFNNIFSKRLNLLDSNSNFSKIEEVIKEDLVKIEKLQLTSNINNFFPYYKICEYLNRYIEKKLEESSFKSNQGTLHLEDAKEGLYYLRKYFETFKDNLKWSRIHLNYAYQLPFNESIKEFALNDKKINIFTSSTFSLPIDFNKYQEFKNQTEAFILRIDNEIKSLQQINSLMAIYESEKEELEIQIKDGFKKNIELLGIFSAIIALLFQGVYTSQSNEGFESKFYTFIVMFIILFSFLSLLRTFISNKKAEKSDLSIINIITALVIPILLIIILILFKI